MTGATLDPAEERLFEQAGDRERAPVESRELRATCLAVGVFLAVAIPLSVLGHDQRDLDVPLAAGLVLAYAALNRLGIPVGHGFALPTQLVLLPMLFLLPPATVPLLVALGAVLSQVPRHLTGERHPTRSLLSIADAGYALGPALVLVAAGAPGPSWEDVPILAAALLAQMLADFLFAAGRESLRLGVRASLQLRLMATVWIVDLLLAPIGLLAAIEARWAFLATLPLAVLLARLAAERGARLEQAVELSSAYRGTAMLLGDVIEEDDAYTGEHTHGVVTLATAVADEMGLSEQERWMCEFGALLHDVGKIAIPKSIVNKPGPLDDEEWAIMRTHTIEGQRMLDRVGGVLRDVGIVVRASHERWDGGGYPDGLVGEEIPLAARIVCCADAYSAITTDRPYRAARTLEEAVAELRGCAGSQFDPEVVEATVAVVVRAAGPPTAAAAPTPV